MRLKPALALVPLLLADGSLAEVARSTAASDSRGPIYRAAPPLSETVERRILPQLELLSSRLLQQRRDMTLDGVKVFDSDDAFLPGKIAIGLAHLLIATPRQEPRFAELAAGYGAIAELTLEHTNKTWGIYYYLLALYKLEQAGLLDEALSRPTLDRLRQRLDWRSFVRESDLSLIELPNNYYGVAFGVARLRNLLGWETATASQALLAKTLQHYRQYSGEYGFADETDGDGRFDRYSVLLIAEIAQRFIETGMQPPDEVKQWLRKSVDFILPRCNLRGEGFEYGRSIGAYGETAMLEILSAAATLGVLKAEEQDMAYAFAARITARYADYWLDPSLHSVNLWNGGRRTDAYRGKHRILGENLSLAHQHIYTNALWNALGYRKQTPSARYAAWLDTLPASTTTWFARGEYDRLSVTYRDRGRVIGVPLINGGKGQHMNTPYFPVPFSPGMLQGSPDATYPQLLPRFTLADGSMLMPLAYFKDAKVTRDGERTLIEYRQDELDRMGNAAPRKDARLNVNVRYELAPGRITRTDRYTSAAPVDIKAIELELGTFSSGAAQRELMTRFSDGEIYEFEVRGLDHCQVEPVSEIYQTPVGALRSRVRCHSGPSRLESAIGISWTLKYRPESMP